jgi:hypothetical protein
MIGPMWMILRLTTKRLARRRRSAQVAGDRPRLPGLWPEVTRLGDVPLRRALLLRCVPSTRPSPSARSRPERRKCEMSAKLGGYPVDKLGNILGPECFDSDELPTVEEVRASYSPEHNRWWDERLAKARAARQKRERGWAQARLARGGWHRTCRARTRAPWHLRPSRRDGP